MGWTRAYLGRYYIFELAVLTTPIITHGWESFFPVLGKHCDPCFLALWNALDDARGEKGGGILQNFNFFNICLKNFLQILHQKGGVYVEHKYIATFSK